MTTLKVKCDSCGEIIELGKATQVWEHGDYHQCVDCVAKEVHATKDGQQVGENLTARKLTAKDCKWFGGVFPDSAHLWCKLLRNKTMRVAFSDCPCEHFLVPTEASGEVKKTWNCRFHPTEGFHEKGCPHTTEAWAKKWGAEYTSLCKNCGVMTYTIDGACSKCKEVK